VRHEHKCSCIRGIAVCRTNRVEAFSGAAGARALKKIGLERGAMSSTASIGALARSLKYGRHYGHHFQCLVIASRGLPAAGFGRQGS
jgi:hypothetical protein